MQRDIIVLKFGSSVLGSLQEVATAAHEIYRWYREGHRVVAVVSAMGSTTDELMQRARTVATHPEPYALAELLATGERAAASLLGITLNTIGVPSRVVDPREIGMLAMGPVLDSQPVAIDAERVAYLLEENAVLAVPGFFAYDNRRRLHLLGRGGSDLTAVFIAGALKAQRCRLLKDVDGVYDRDPATTERGDDTDESPAQKGPANRFLNISYARALEVAGRLIQPKAIHFLERHQATAEIAAPARNYQTVVGGGTRALIKSVATVPRRVLLLGLGTVGGGILQRLLTLPQQFKVVGALVRNPERHMASGVPTDLLQASAPSLRLDEADIVVDALPGLEPSRLLVQNCIRRGIDVVTANKRLVSDAGADLSSQAARHGACLLYSAAVGGSAPMIEALRRLSLTEKVTEISGVLNGTCNFVIDYCSKGARLEEAVREAQRLGFAETPADEDLSGRDAARKLKILARHAFGQDLHTIEVKGIEAAELLQMQDGCRDGEVVRLVGSARWDRTRVVGKVFLAIFPASHPFASIRQEWNALRITCEGGAQTLITGRGAGRWPAAEAVIADLLDLHRMRSA